MPNSTVRARRREGPQFPTSLPTKERREGGQRTLKGMREVRPSPFTADDKAGRRGGEKSPAAAPCSLENVSHRTHTQTRRPPAPHQPRAAAALRVAGHTSLAVRRSSSPPLWEEESGPASRPSIRARQQEAGEEAGKQVAGNHQCLRCCRSTCPKPLLPRSGRDKTGEGRRNTSHHRAHGQREDAYTRLVLAHTCATHVINLLANMA